MHYIHIWDNSDQLIFEQLGMEMKLMELSNKRKVSYKNI